MNSLKTPRVAGWTECVLCCVCVLHVHTVSLLLLLPMPMCAAAPLALLLVRLAQHCAVCTTTAAAAAAAACAEAHYTAAGLAAHTHTHSQPICKRHMWPCKNQLLERGNLAQIKSIIYIRKQHLSVCAGFVMMLTHHTTLELWNTNKTLEERNSRLQLRSESLKWWMVESSVNKGKWSADNIFSWL